jgi:hypothetical protein
MPQVVAYIWPTPEGWPHPDPRNPGYRGPTWKTIVRDRGMPLFDSRQSEASTIPTETWESFAVGHRPLSDLRDERFIRWVWGKLVRTSREAAIVSSKILEIGEMAR